MYNDPNTPPEKWQKLIVGRSGRLVLLAEVDTDHQPPSPLPVSFAHAWT